MKSPLKGLARLNPNERDVVPTIIFLLMAGFFFYLWSAL